jgi:hypothetical protein
LRAFLQILRLWGPTCNLRKGLDCKKFGQIDLIAKLKKFTGLKKRKVDQNAIIKD